MRKIIGVILLFIVLSLLIFYAHFYLTQSSYQQSFNKIKDHQKVQISLGDAKMWVEIVNSKQSRVNGLSKRSEIGSDGMLFIFEEKQRLQFWMKEMSFDLDMIWLADGQVIEITENVKALKNSVKTDELQTYSPQHLADMVLEVNSGDSKKLNIKIGDKIKVIKY